LKELKEYKTLYFWKRLTEKYPKIDVGFHDDSNQGHSFNSNGLRIMAVGFLNNDQKIPYNDLVTVNDDFSQFQVHYFIP
jgi:hypothetical protein